MQTAAIIVGINTYSKNSLTSAVNDALAFKDALLKHKVVSSDQEIIVLITDPQSGGQEPTRNNIIDALYNFYEEGDGLKRLIFFYAGHGILTFSDAAHARPRTVLVPMDVRNLNAHGDRLIDLNEVLDFMRRAGPQEQIFIIDACRDLAWDKHPTVGVTGWAARDSGTGERAQATLYAVSEKGKALGQQNGMGIMSRHLIDALEGNGIAKVFDDATGSWLITVNSIGEYVKKAIQLALNDPPIFMLPQLHAPDPQASPIRVLENVDDEQLVININPDESAADTKVTVKLRTIVQDSYSLPPRKNHEVLRLPPLWYRIEATHHSYVPVPARRDIDLRAEHEVNIVVPIPGVPPTAAIAPSLRRGPGLDELSPPPSPPAIATPRTTVDDLVDGAAFPPGQGQVKATALERQVAIELESLRPPYKSWLGYGTLDQLVPVGPYRIRFRLGPDVFNESDIYVQEEIVNVAATAAVTPLLREALSIPDEPPANTEISESIGTIQSGVLQTLLPIVGIKPFDVNDELFHRFSGLVEIRDPEDFEMSPLSLVIAFDGEWPNSVPELIDKASCEILLSSGERFTGALSFRPLVSANSGFSTEIPGGMERIGVALATPPRGSFTLILRLPFRNIHLFSAGLKNRATVITLTLRPNGSVDISQNILRLPGRDYLYSKELSPHVSYGQMLRELQLGQQLFKSDELVSDRFFETAPYLIRDLFYAKWTDPILSCMAIYASYEFSGERSFERLHFGRDLLMQTASNLRRYFDELPDAHMVFGLMHEDQRFSEIDYLLRTRQVPLLAPGFRHLMRFANEPLFENPFSEYASRIEVDQSWTTIFEPRIDSDRRATTPTRSFFG